MKKKLISNRQRLCKRIIVLSVFFLFILPITLLGQIKISGKVADATDGTPLPGANIVIKGSTSGTVTDQNGAFTLEAPSDAILVISYVGYLTEEIEVAGKQKIDIVLAPDLAKLEEVVVVGYGTMRKTDVTGAVSSLREDDIKSLKSSNAVEALQGKIAGVDMTRSDGRAGSGYNILIRGARSFSASNDPIYIVDGVDYGSNININPNDIASIDVLKDASSTAIYGSRGANGVVLITTKKGNQGKTMVNFNTYYGFTTPLGKLPMGDADYYLRMIRDVYRTDHPAYWDSADSQVPILSLLSDEAIEGYYKGTDFDWIDAQMKDHGSQQDYYLSVSGGGEKSNYLISLNHFVEDNYIPNDNYKRYSVKSDVNTKVGKLFEMGNSTFISYSLLNRGQGINYNFIPLVVPYDSLGNLIPIPNSKVPFSNMLIDQDPKYKSNENSRTGLFSTFYGQLNLLPGLIFKSSFNVTMDFQRIGTYTGKYEGLDRSNEASLTIINNYKWTWTNILTYDKTLSNHHIFATAATETRFSLTERYYQAVKELNLGEFKWYAIRTGNPKQLTIDDKQSPYIKSTMVSFIGRLNYSFKEKYLATFTGRYDGASQLKEKWDFFPSVSVGWRISEESFMKGLEFLSNLKLRVGYGLTGNYSVDPYSSLGLTIEFPLYYQFGVTETDINGYRTGKLSTSPKWETSAATNFGMDFGFLRNRISGSLEIYKVHTYDILQEVILPPTSAVTVVVENIGETKGNGVELTINSVNIQTKNFKWSTSITFSRSTEEITYLAGGVTQDVVNKWFVGQPLKVFYDWEKIGIWQTDEAAQAAKYGSKPGDIKLNDVNSDTLLTDIDRVVLGTPRPKWTGGLNSTVNYKNFDFSIFVYARMGQMIMDVVEGMWSPDCRENSVERDYWTPNNPTNEYPRINPGLTRSGWSKATTLQYTDGSFVKIKDITLGYKIPANITSKMAVSSFRVYISAKNFFVFGKNFSKGRYDPEAVNADGESNIGFPAPKMIAIGANVTF